MTYSFIANRNIGIAENTLNFYVITRSFAKAKQRGDLKIIIV